jgi:cold shock CspA family protein
MVRSGERTASREANQTTFHFSNILAQAINNNTGPWNGFENYYRQEVKDKGLVAQVIAGGVFGKAPVAERNVRVPSATWKVVVFLRPGQTVQQIDERTRVVSILVPNNNVDVRVEYDWERYRTSVAEIERAIAKADGSQLHLFDQLPPAVAERLRSSVDQVAIPPAPPSRFVPQNYAPSENRPGLQRDILARQVTGTVLWYSTDKKYGFIRLPNGKDVFVHANERLTSIREGEEVTFDLARGRDGRQFAAGVRSHSPQAMPE